MRISPLFIVIVTLLAHVAAASIPCGSGQGMQPASHVAHEVPPAPQPAHGSSHGSHHAAAHAHPAETHPAGPALARTQLEAPCSCGCGEGTPLDRASAKRLGPAVPSAGLALVFDRPVTPLAGSPVFVSRAPAPPDRVPIAS